MSTFFIRVFIFILFLSLNLAAQDLIRVVDAATHQPVADVNINSSDRNNFTSSNNQGLFNLALFGPADTLIFTHINYSTLTIPYDSVKNVNNIFMIPASIKQEEILITGDKSFSNITSEKEVIILSDELAASFVTIGDLLKNSTSLFVKDHGGFGGVKNVSSRGMSSENTIVLFNETRVNDLRTGLFDFASLSTSSIEKIIYDKNFDSESGYSSPGGIVNIFSTSSFKGRKLNTGLKLSSDMYQSYFVNYTDGNENLFFNVSGERAFSSNRYNYTFNDLHLKRNNAHFNKTFFSGSLNYLNDKQKISLYSNYSYFNSGIPGFVVSNNYNSSNATNRNSSYIAILNNEYNFSDNISITNIFSFDSQKLFLVDPDGIFIQKGEERDSKLNDFSFTNRFSFKTESITFNLGHEFITGSLNNIATFVSGNLSPGKISRVSNRLFSAAGTTLTNPTSFLTLINFSAGAAYEMMKEEIKQATDEDGFSYRFNLSFVPSFTNKILLRTNFSSNHRMPTLNERYYSTLFNHYNLKKESYKSIDAGLEYLFTESITLSATYFYITGKDKIIWIPTRLALQTPRNIADVVSSGVEFNVSIMFLENLKSNLSYNYTDARNKTKINEQDLSYDKKLIYTPEHRFNANLDFDYKNFFVNLSSSFVSERFFTSDNSPSSVLPEYFLLDVSLLYKFSLFNFNHSIGITTYNLLNEEYFIIQSYPMPLRTFLFTYKLELL